LSPPVVASPKIGRQGARRKGAPPAVCGWFYLAQIQLGLEVLHSLSGNLLPVPLLSHRIFHVEAAVDHEVLACNLVGRDHGHHRLSNVAGSGDDT